MEKKYLKGNLDRNLAFGLSWALQTLFYWGWIAAIVLFIVDKETLDLEDRRELVSMIICAAAAVILSLTLLVPLYIWICQIIAAIKAFMGESFQIPGVYQIAAAIIKE